MFLWFEYQLLSSVKSASTGLIHTFQFWRKLGGFSSPVQLWSKPYDSAHLCNSKDVYVLDLSHRIQLSVASCGISDSCKFHFHQSWGDVQCRVNDPVESGFVHHHSIQVARNPTASSVDGLSKSWHRHKAVWVHRNACANFKETALDS